MTGRIGFRPLAAGDLALMRAWLVEPHVSRWWGDPDTEVALMRKILTEAETEAVLLCLDEAPFAYVQAWEIGAAGAYCDQPDGSVAIDCFIGPPAMLRRGHGARLLAAFTDELFARRGLPCILTDPDPANSRGVRAYIRAGFRALGERDTPDGPVVLPARDPGQGQDL